MSTFFFFYQVQNKLKMFLTIHSTLLMQWKFMLVGEKKEMAHLCET